MSDTISVHILIAIHDENDRLLAQEALTEGRLRNELRFVNDGEELMDYLLQRGKYSTPAPPSRPGLILLDLNIPHGDGYQLVKEIKQNENLCYIPLIILVDTDDDVEVLENYNDGVNSVIVKPVTFEAVLEVIKVISHYWFEIVELPIGNNGDYT